MKRSYIFILIVLIVGFATSYSQEKTEAASSERRTITVKELDAFHELLHPLVHEAYPNKDYVTIKKALPELIECASGMKNASLPKELTANAGKYKKETRKLIKQLTELDKKKAKYSDDKFGKKFMKMHDTFEGIMEMVR